MPPRKRKSEQLPWDDDSSDDGDDEGPAAISPIDRLPWDDDDSDGGDPGADHDVPDFYETDSEDGGEVIGPAVDGFEGMNWESDTDDDQPEDDGEQKAIHFCISLLLTRYLSARLFCTLMYYLGLAGLGKCRKLGLKPSSSSGHFNRKVRSSLKLYGKEGLYKLQVRDGHGKGYQGCNETCMCTRHMKLWTLTLGPIHINLKNCER